MWTNTMQWSKQDLQSIIDKVHKEMPELDENAKNNL